MTINMFGWAGLLAMSAIAAPWMTDAIAQNVPQPQQNDVRAAVARINPTRPIQVRVISQTQEPVVASIVPAAGYRNLAPGQTVTFGRLHTSYLPLPMDLQVTLQNTPDPNNPVQVFLDVKPVGNEIVVRVKTSTGGNGSPSQTVNVDDKGAIYIY